ncbi:MAG: protein phosphatase 2C domain-containing protein [Oscillatoriophycideae cyanobacterium NC_groundwater_1537_Pr4_S-0.65um_50_18]|nr:protein phosphatase 2C domain-containing protein [Oscillatoriophycideae cyanobacterium NC_groundwater_1537_Pr4_S-0.65um_50_18]
MSYPSLRIQCVNSDCLHPDNAPDQAVCDRCQTPLVHRYLWASSGANCGVVNPANIPVDTKVADRYWVIRPQIWLDTQPVRAADVPNLMPETALAYLYLYSHRLHLPGLYGFCAETEETPAIALLDNAPLDATGQLLPHLVTAWKTVSSVRQIYWLWQILQLWRPLRQQGVATSLLVPDNLHVEGWRVRLRELLSDRPELSQPDSSTESPEPITPSLKGLGALWQTWVTAVPDSALPESTAPESAAQNLLQEICQQMQTAEEKDFEAIATRLDTLLLEQTAQMPLYLDIAGATTTGPQRNHNEDACFPIASPADETLAPYVGIICDGIGGHEGGEVASQLALRSLQLQIRVLLAELPGLAEPLTPAVVKQQLTETVRVVNNLIANQNDTQKRELRQRMGTTLVMALQFPQKIPLGPEPTQTGKSHELYLVHVGDSRAYWLTSNYVHQLTLDDDVATREVLMGRSPYQESLRRPDSGALTQALGTRKADLVEVNVQRFVLEEDGLLLLCSDGLSDYDRVEQCWQPIAQAVLESKISLREAVQEWISIANQKNGHDNTSVVLMRCLVSQPPQPVSPPALPDPVAEPQAIALPALDTELADSSRALLYDEEPPKPATASVSSSTWKPLTLGVRLLGLLVLAVIAGILGMAIWQQMERSASPSLPSSSSPAPQ